MLTQYAVTSVFDIGSVWESTRIIRSRIESGEVPGPRIRSTGEILMAKGAVSAPELKDALGFMRSKLP